MITLSFRSGLMIVLGILYAAVAICTVLQFREGRPVKQTLSMLPFYTCFISIGGVVLTIPFYAFDDPVSGIFGGFGILCQCVALVCANQRIIWDDKGFWYRTMLRRTVRYGYEDIRCIKPVFASSPMGSDLYIHVGHRHLLIDEMCLWQRFTGAYENWQTRSGGVSWRRELHQRFEGRYHSHGSFRRKLDRIPGGYFKLFVYSLFGLWFVFSGVLLIVTLKSIGQLVFALSAFWLSTVFFKYWYAVAHIDDKPRLISKYLSSNSHIRPDPDAKPKVYRRAKRKKGR